MHVFTRPLTLRLVREGSSYLDTMFLVEAIAGQAPYSSDLQEILQRFIKEPVSFILNDYLRHPGKTKFPYTEPFDDIRKELAFFRHKHYGDFNTLSRLLADNPVLWRSPLSQISPRQLSGNHVSLSSYVVSAIDRIILMETRQWWNKQEGAVPLSEELYAHRVVGNVRPFSYPFDPIPAFTMEVTADTSAVGTLSSKVPFNSASMLDLTKYQLDVLLTNSRQHPEKSLEELAEAAPPDFAALPFSKLKDVVKQETSLMLMNVFPIVEEIEDRGTLGSLVLASVESAVSSNIKILAKDPAISSQVGVTKPVIPPGGTVPGKRRPIHSMMAFVPIKVV